MQLCSIPTITILFNSFICLLISVEVELRAPPKYVINLDAPATDRWTQVIHDFKKPIHEASKRLMDVIPSYVKPLVEKIAAQLDNHFHAPFPDELRGIAKAANISLGDVIIANIVYDITTFCTSFVARDGKGMIWHGRNMDYSLGHATNSTDILKDLTIQVDFQHNHTTVYRGVTFASYIGFVTVQKPNVATITVDERDHGAWWINVLMAILDKRVQPMSFVVRETMEYASSFKEVLYLLENTITTADVYYIVGGMQKNDGAVITKARLTYDDVWTLQPHPGRWFLVETNDDHWKPPEDLRRQTAIKQIHNMGQNITTEKMFAVLSTHPVLNPRTVYQIVMSAGGPHLFNVRIVTK